MIVVSEANVEAHRLVGEGGIARVNWNLKGQDLTSPSS